MLLTYFYRKTGNKWPEGALQVTASDMDSATLEAINMVEEMGYDLKTTDVIFAGYYA